MLNINFTERCEVNPLTTPWEASPEPLVKRRLIERDGGEIARATSIVRYGAGARFKAHCHDFGEEVFVLEGVFSDEHGDYGTGSYIKSPPDSTHAPFSESGCTLFVKLRHMHPEDQSRVVVDTRSAPWQPGMIAGLSVMPLSEFGRQHTALVRWAPATFFSPHRHYGGEEILAVDGVFEDEHGRYPAGTWLRSPHLSRHQPFSVEGCTIFVKTGHLL